MGHCGISEVNDLDYNVIFSVNECKDRQIGPLNAKLRLSDKMVNVCVLYKSTVEERYFKNKTFSDQINGATIFKY